MTGWRRGLCRAGAPMPQQEVPPAAGTATMEESTVRQAMPEQGLRVYGRGCGGIPRGCGRGFGGGMGGSTGGPRCGGRRWRT